MVYLPKTTHIPKKWEYPIADEMCHDQDETI